MQAYWYWSYIVRQVILQTETVRVDDPAQVASADLSDSNFSRVQQREASYFTALTTLYLNGNNLQLSELEAFPALIEVHLQCNGIKEIALTEDAFCNLTVQTK